MRLDESGSETTSASRILDERAKGLSRPFGSPGPAGRLHLIVRVGGRHVAVPMAALRSVVPTPPITCLPSDDRSLIGLVALGGEVVPVADLATLLGFEESRDSERLLLVVQDGDSQLALKVEAVEGHETLLPHLPVDIDLSDSAEALVKLLAPAPGRDDLLVLDIDAALADSRLSLLDATPGTGPEGGR